MRYKALTLNEALSSSGMSGQIFEYAAQHEYNDVWGFIIEYYGDSAYVIELMDSDDERCKLLNEAALRHLAADLYIYVQGACNTYDARKKHMENPSLRVVSSSTRLNDTPQDGGAWSDDKHTSSISVTEQVSTLSSEDYLRYVNQLKADYVHEFLMRFEIYESMDGEGDAI